MKKHVFRGMGVILVCILLGLVFSDASAGVMIKPMVKHGKGPWYSVTGHGGKPLIGNRISVERGTNALLNATVSTAKGKKTITAPFIEVGSDRFEPAPQQGIVWNGKTYSSAFFRELTTKGPIVSAPKKNTDYKILLEAIKRPGISSTEPLEKIEGHISKHYPDLHPPEDICKHSDSEYCKRVRH